MKKNNILDNRVLAWAILLYFILPSISFLLRAEDNVGMPLSKTEESLSKSHQDESVSNETSSIKLLSPGDRIFVKIYPEDQYINGGEIEVNPDGFVTLPLAGKINVLHMSIVEAEQEITKILAADYFVNPEVSIEFRETNVKAIGPSFLVLGAVKQPGTYHLSGDGKPLRMLEAILMAGGFSEVANQKKIKIVREVNGSKTSLRVNAEQILNGESADINIKGGDIIHVSESVF